MLKKLVMVLMMLTLMTLQNFTSAEVVVNSKTLPSKQTKPAGDHTKLTSLTVVLDWFVNPNHAPIFVAEQQGYFKQFGLQVKLIPPADPADPPKLVAVGKADIAIDYQPHWLLEKAQGLPLVQVGTLIATPLNCITVLAASPIHSIADLKGKTIGYASAGADTAMLKAMLQQAGLNLQDVQLINVRYNLTQALLSKRVDAVSGMMRNFELTQMQLINQPGRAFFPEENGVPPYDELIYVTQTKLQKDPRINQFLQAVALGVQYLVNHPQSSWQQFAKNHPELNNTLNEKAWYATLPRFALRPGAQDRQRCLQLAAYLTKTLQVKIPVSACQSQC